MFIKEKMFESQSLKRLRFFLKLNIIPLCYITIFFILPLIKGMSFRLEDDYFIVFAHLVLILNYYNSNNKQLLLWLYKEVNG